MRKIKILFVCKGNICRSTMAQFVFIDKAQKYGISERFFVDSAATTAEQLGRGIAQGTIEKLEENNIEYEEHFARKMTKEDYKNYDYIIAMEASVVQGIFDIIEKDVYYKVFQLYDFSKETFDVVDPIYTNDFDRTYREIDLGCQIFLEYLMRNVVKERYI